MKFLVLLTTSLTLILIAAIGNPIGTVAFSANSQDADSNQPDRIVRLIFIHHSTGENWLADEDGGLALELGRNNYFVSDTNYGWGPDSIGDRTDIPDWIEWFRGPDSGRFLTMLFQEDEQHSEYSRFIENPGGENEIIMFKSCFPNSNLEGNPDDPPGSWADYSVAGAKYVYNQILEYFGTRTDKLFIVITAPPVSDSTYAVNARAFNNWLVFDWLKENDYPLNNVAVFDFYNLLTGPDNHHRVGNGQIEHIAEAGRDTAHYTTEDDHPSAPGNRKATEEFVPMLNVFFNRWQVDSPTQIPVVVPPDQEEQLESPPDEVPLLSAMTIDDFEGNMPPDSSGWEPAWDASTSSRITCGISSSNSHVGESSLEIDFDVAAGSWATCALFFDELQDWSEADGLAFQLNAAQPGTNVEFNLYAGGEEQDENYLYSFTASQQSSDAWVPMTIKWGDFQRVEWEENSGQSFEAPERIHGLAFGFSEGETGRIWIDDLELYTGEIEPLPELLVDEPTEEDESGGMPFCGGSLASFMIIGMAYWIQSRRRDFDG